MSLDRIKNIIQKVDEAESIEKVKKENYGRQVIINLHSVDRDKFSVESLRHYAEQLCDEIGMQRGPMHVWGNNKQLGKDHDPKADGLSVVQFLYQSSIVVHAPDELEKVFVTIFSCKEFDPEKAKKFTLKWFGGKIVSMHNIVME